MLERIKYSIVNKEKEGPHNESIGHKKERANHRLSC